METYLYLHAVEFFDTYMTLSMYRKGYLFLFFFLVSVLNQNTHNFCGSIFFQNSRSYSKYNSLVVTLDYMAAIDR